jgi:hypothetical protein
VTAAAYNGLTFQIAKAEFIMIELTISPAIVVVATVAAVAVVLAAVVARRAKVRAAGVERRLAGLYAEIEKAIGSRIDRGVGGGWRDQVSVELKRLAASSETSRRDTAAADWTSIAVRAIDEAARVVQLLKPGGEPAGITAALGLAERLATSREAIAALAKSSDLQGALVSGTLNDVLTTAPLLAAYFGRDAELAPIIEAYLLAAAALRLSLANANIVVETPAVLSIVSGRDIRGEAVDGRELRRIPHARALANRVADRLVSGENLVVYCSVPGWTTREECRPAAAVFWNSASWLA